jgi:putative flippase GtrA
MFVCALKKRFFRFLIVGIINTLFSFSIYALLTALGFHYSLSILLANGLGVLFNFRTISTYVFNVKDNHLIFKFSLISLIIYLLSVQSIKFLLHVQVNKYLAGAVIALPMAILSFFLNKLFVYKDPRS